MHVDVGYNIRTPITPFYETKDFKLIDINSAYEYMTYTDMGKMRLTCLKQWNDSFKVKYR